VGSGKNKSLSRSLLRDFPAALGLSPVFMHPRHTGPVLGLPCRKLVATSPGGPVRLWKSDQAGDAGSGV